MLSIVKSMSLEGLEGYLVEVETDIAGGLPSFNIVGLPDISIKEAKERVRASIKNNDIEFPSRRILVNLSPADKRKEGTTTLLIPKFLASIHIGKIPLTLFIFPSKDNSPKNIVWIILSLFM